MLKTPKENLSVAKLYLQPRLHVLSCFACGSYPNGFGNRLRCSLELGCLRSIGTNLAWIHEVSVEAEVVDTFSILVKEGVKIKVLKNVRTATHGVRKLKALEVHLCGVRKWMVCLDLG